VSFGIFEAKFEIRINIKQVLNGEKVLFNNEKQE
jgi:hypothetical protein